MTPLIQLFVDLAAIPSPPGDERSVADWVAAYARGLGLHPQEDEAAATLGGSAGNVLVRLAATSGEDEATPILLCAHLDTVPPEGEIRPIVEDGIVRNGTGAGILGADDKSAVATLLHAIRRIVEEGIPHGPIELLFTVMEEVGCRGAKAFDTSSLQAQAGFVYDHAAPPGGILLSAPFGYRMDVEFRGRSAHAGMVPEKGRSAIAAAADGISKLPLGRIDPETTLNVGLIEGGTAPNIVPPACSAVVDARSRDERRARNLVDSVSEIFRAAAAGRGCSVEFAVEEKYRGYRLTAMDAVVELGYRALRACGLEPIPLDGGGGSDANIFNARGLPCVNLANGMSEIHTPDEYIRVDDLVTMEELTLALVDEARVELSIDPALDSPKSTP